MKKIYLIVLVLMGFSAKAQYFQSLYGNTFIPEFLTDGNNAYSGGNTGHFLIGPGGIAPGAVFLMNVQRTDMDGLIGGPQTFNNSYGLTYIVSPPATPAAMRVNQVHSTEFSNGSGFAIAGSYTSTGGMGIFYTNMDPGGNIMNSSGYFQTLFGVTHSFISVREIVESPSNPGDLYITGYLTVAATGNNRVFVIKIDQAGTLLWGSTYDMTANYNTDSDKPYDLVESTNYIPYCGCPEVMVVGEHLDKTTAAPLPDAFFLRLNSSTGVPTQQVDFYGTANSSDVFTSIVQSGNTNIDPNSMGFAIGGYSDMLGSYDMWLTALDINGSIIWDQLFDYTNFSGTVNNDYCNDIMERFNTSGDYEYYLAGYTDQGYFGFEDVMVIKADNNGNGVAGGQFTYGEVDVDRGIRIDQLNGFGPDNDGIAIYGYSWYVPPYQLGGYDHFLVKAYFNGITACQQQFENPTQNPGNTSQYTANTGEFWPNSFYDYPFLVDLYQNLKESQICYTTSDPDGTNARIAPSEPKGDKQATVSPNPMAQGSPVAMVELEADASVTVQVTIYDMLGKQYYNAPFTLAKGKNQLPVNLSDANMAAGMYTVKVSGTNINKNILLMVK